MKKKLMLALIVAAAALAGVAATHKLALAAEPGDPCTTDRGRSGYLIATGEDLVCVVDEGGE